MDAVPDRIDEDVLTDLRERLRRYRRVPLPAGQGWGRGTDSDYLAELVAYWAETYDWRPHEERLRSLPWELVGDLRVIHQRGGEPGDQRVPVVLLHGWPDSFVRFSRALPLLADLDVMVPCLPGFPYAPPEPDPGMGAAAMAERIATALADLGYDRYVVSGGDVGSSVAEHLASQQPDRVAALHLTDIPYTHLFSIEASDLSAAERDYLQAGQAWQFAEGAYALEQSTKPHTLAVGLGDSPAGLAAWIVEKLRSWSDCDGDVESVYPREDLLTWITLYWVTGSIGTSFLPYVAHTGSLQGRIDVPTVATIFPKDLVPAPREFAERFFDIRGWDELTDGGHFGAWERPEAYVAGVRQAVALAGHRS